jgi:hypothetical protein
LRRREALIFRGDVWALAGYFEKIDVFCLRDSSTDGEKLKFRFVNG